MNQFFLSLPFFVYLFFLFFSLLMSGSVPLTAFAPLCPLPHHQPIYLAIHPSLSPLVMSCCKTHQKKKEVKLWKNKIKWKKEKPWEGWLTKSLLLIPSFDVTLIWFYTFNLVVLLSFSLPLFCHFFLYQADQLEKNPPNVVWDGVLSKTKLLCLRGLKWSHSIIFFLYFLIYNLWHKQNLGGVAV